MSAPIPVSQTIQTRFSALLTGLHRAHARVLAQFVVGILLADHVALPKVAGALGWAVRRDSTERQLRRWLANRAVVVETVWAELRPALLRDWAGREVVLVLDGTPHRADWTILTVGIVAHRRVLPLGGVVVPQQRRWPQPLAATIRPLCQGIAAALPPDTPVTLLADRGLSGPTLIDLCTELGWHYTLRVNVGPRVDKRVRTPDGRVGSLWALVTASPRRRVLRAACFPTGRARDHWREGALTIHRARAFAEPWVLVSDRPGGSARVREYRQRHTIEATFQDLKRRGWQIEASRLRHADRIERLLLVLYLAYWWVHQLGVRAVRHGQRRQHDRCARPDLSLAALGRLIWHEQVDQQRCPPLPLRRSGEHQRYVAYLP